MTLLALNWTFDTVTGSDASGQFIAQDLSSGSSDVIARYNWLGDVVGKQYLARGYDFPASFSGSINKKYIHSAKKQLPEVINSSDTVNIAPNDDVTYTRDKRPIDNFMLIEKSMYQTISQEIINMFATIKDFNNLIGEPVNMYRQKYKRMEKLRQLFFEQVGNVPDLDKYLEYYKWLDNTLNIMLGYLIPASSNLSANDTIIQTTVESHVLERNKYTHQYPTLEDRTPDPEGKIFGINELLYNWEFGHAPLLDFWSSKSLAVNGTANQSLTSIADAASLSFGADGTTGNEPEFSISAWINMTDAASFYIFEKIEGTAFEYMFYTQNNGTLIFKIFDATSGNYIYTVGDDDLREIYEGRWIHVCATYDASRASGGMKLYINGSDIGASGATVGSYTAMHNTAAGASIGRYSPTSTIAALISEGYIDEVSIYDANLSAAEVSELYNGGYVFDLATFSAASDRVSWWRMGDPPDLVGSSPDFTIIDKVGSNDITMSNFQGNSTSGIVGLAAPFKPSTTACLWWNDRAERSVVSSGVTLVDEDREQLLKVKTTVANATAPTLAESSSAGISVYNGSTYALRNLARPYRLKIDEAKGLHGGINFSRNKTLDHSNPLFREFESAATRAPGLKVQSTSLESGSCTDDSALDDKLTVTFKVETPAYSAVDSEPYLDGTGELLAPFNIVSSSVEQTSFTKVNVVNLHHDTYGYDKESTLQSPFTEKFVGGKPYRHTWNNFDLDSNNMEDRAEGWRIIDSSTVLSMSAPNFTTDGAVDQDLPRSTFYRDETAKRPVNIRNIQQQTGSELSGDFTVIGNYSNDYDILHTAGRTINNRYLIEAGGLSGSAVNSAVIEGLVDYAVPIRDISGGKQIHLCKPLFCSWRPCSLIFGNIRF